MGRGDGGVGSVVMMDEEIYYVIIPLEVQSCRSEIKCGGSIDSVEYVSTYDTPSTRVQTHHLQHS